MSHHLPMYEFSIYVNLIGFFKKKKIKLSNVVLHPIHSWDLLRITRVDSGHVRLPAVYMTVGTIPFRKL